MDGLARDVREHGGRSHGLWRVHRVARARDHWPRSATASAVVAAFAVLQWRGVRIGDAAQQLTSLFKCVALAGLAVVALVTAVDPAASAPVAAAATPAGLAFAGAVVVALQSAI